MAEILDLQTRQERPSIRIDGTVYELILPSDLDLEEAIWLEKAGRKIGIFSETLKDDEKNEEAARQLRELLKRFVSILLREAPEEVIERLSDVQRLAVVNAYSQKIAQEKHDFFGLAGMSPPEEAPPSGSTSSRRSAASTAAAPKTG